MTTIYRHIGIRIRGALIASIYNKALSVDLSASKESIGKINNLISVDVGVSVWFVDFFIHRSAVYLWDSRYNFQQCTLYLCYLCVVINCCEFATKYTTP